MESQSVVSWALPASNGGAAITSYLVYAYIDAAGTTLASGPTNPQTDSTVAGCTTTSSSCSHAFTGLSNGTTYWFRIAAVSGALAKERISLESMLQRGRSQSGEVPVVLTTHVTEEAAMQRAVARIARLGAVAEDPCLIRIETF